MATIKTHLLDASALVKLVVTEHKSDVVRNYFNNHSVFWTTSFCLTEAFGVLKTKHSRYGKNKKGLLASIKAFFCGKPSADDGISEEVYLAALEELVSMIRNETISIEEENIFNREIYNEVEQLCSKHGLDAIDTFQLVTMLRGFPSKMSGESSTILITADRKLANAAKAEGLQSWYCIKEPSPI
ncbi:MAG: type II toxin-antitoxin system VapC family toxin [Candidatus Thiodiazotropha sp.]